MCNDVCVDGKYANNQGELQNLLGGDLICDHRYIEDAESNKVHDFVKAAFASEACLCPIDLVKTADKYGYSVTDKGEDGEYDPFTFYFVKQLPEVLR
jgi:hypothetical protein